MAMADEWDTAASAPGLQTVGIQLVAFFLAGLVRLVGVGPTAIDNSAQALSPRRGGLAKVCILQVSACWVAWLALPEVSSMANWRILGAAAMQFPLLATPLYGFLRYIMHLGCRASIHHDMVRWHAVSRPPSTSASDSMIGDA